MSVMVILFAGVALAALIEGDDGPNPAWAPLRPTASTATVAPTTSEVGAAATRCASVAAKDEDHGGYGDDFIGAVDGSEDDIFCGPGSDRARANPGDNVAEGCEKVIRDGIRVDRPQG